MSTPNPFLLAVYRKGLRAYPTPFRRRNEEQIVQTVRDVHQEAYSRPAFWISIFGDLLKSIVKENFFMVREQISTRPIFFHALTLGVIFTLMGGAASLVFQQMLRRGANEPQRQMAAAYAAEIASGVKPDEAIPHNYVDLSRSLEPFIIFYNDEGSPTTGSGYLHQELPVPPHGVFNYVRSSGTDTVSWQPQPGVRIAAVIQRVEGATPGFILTGRSLQVVEEQESLFWEMAFTAWFVVIALLIAGAALLSRAQRGHTPLAS